MEPNEEIRRLLEEIRDTQREHLSEYRKAAERSVALQEEAIARQRAYVALYRRWMIAGAVVILPLVGVVLYLMVRLF